MEDKLIFEALRRGIITPNEAKSRLEGSNPPPVPANGSPQDGGDVPPSASAPASDKTLGGTFLSGIKSAGAGAIGTLAEIVDPTPMFGLERVGAVPDLSATKQAAAQVVDKQRDNYAPGLAGQGIGYITEVAANPLNYVGGKGAALAKEAGSAVTGLGSRILARSGQGAVEGLAQGVGTDDSRLTNAAIGAGGAGALTAAGGAIKGAKNAITPEIDQATATLAKRAQDFGIPVSVQQVAPTKMRNTAQKVSAAIPLSGVQKFEDSQRAAFNKAIAGTLGEDAEDLGPETIKNFLSRSSKGFDDVLKGKNVQVDPLNIETLDTLVNNAKGSLSDNLVKVVEKNVNDLKANVGADGVIPGEKIASFRSELLKRISRAESGTKEYLGEVVDVIDDLLDTSIDDEAKQALGSLRRQWRNYRTVEPLLEKATDGQINPTLLQQRVASSPYIKASRTKTGDDDLVDLARIGKQLLPKLGGSDTFEKGALAGGAGTIGITALANPVAAAVLGAKALGGVALNRAFQSFYNQSPARVNAVIERALGKQADKAISMLKKGTPLSAVAQDLKKAGATKEQVDNAMQELTKFTVEGSNELPTSNISRSPTSKKVTK